MSETNQNTTTKAATGKSDKAQKTNGKMKKVNKGELRPIQIRVLKMLAKGACLPRSEMYDRLGYKAHSGLNRVLGFNDPVRRAQADKEGYPSLLSLGYVRIEEVDVAGRAENGYEITAKGKQALATERMRSLFDRVR